MAETSTASYAFAGSGIVNEGNASALLDDFLPLKLGAVFRPERVPRSNKSLSAVITWLESKDVLGPRGTVPSSDVVQSLLDRRSEGDDVTLVVIWPEEPGDDEVDLIRRAFANDIPVKNLAAALADLLYSDVFPEPDSGDQGPPWDEDENAPALAPYTPHPEARNLAKELYESLVAIVRQEIASASAQPEPGSMNNARASTTTDSGKSTTDYFMSLDGEYRIANTARPRKGEQRVSLTDTEVRHLIKEGRIKGA